MFNLLAAQMDATTIIIFAVLIVGIIGLFVWQTISGKKKQKEAQNMVDSLKVGDRVKTIGGVCGFVAEINNEENTFVLETGTETNKSYVKFDKGAIYQTAPAQGSAVIAPVEEKKAEEQPVQAQPEAEEAKNGKKKGKKAKEEKIEETATESEEVKDEESAEPVFEEFKEEKEEK